MKPRPYLKNSLKDYVSGGGLKKAVEKGGKDISKEILKRLTDNLKNITVHYK